MTLELYSGCNLGKFERMIHGEGRKRRRKEEWNGSGLSVAEIVAGCLAIRRDIGFTVVILHLSRRSWGFIPSQKNRNIKNFLPVKTGLQNYGNEHKYKCCLSSESDGNSIVFNCRYTSALPPCLFSPMRRNEIKIGWRASDERSFHYGGERGRSPSGVDYVKPLLKEGK